MTNQGPTSRPIRRLACPRGAGKPGRRVRSTTPRSTLTDGTQHPSHVAAQRPVPRPLGRPPGQPVPRTSRRRAGSSWSRPPSSPSCGPTPRGRPRTATCGPPSSRIDVGGHVISEDLRHWINDGLMAMFFFVLGLEIKQELTNGQLASVRNAAVPAAGALGGMLLPAVLYLAFNLGGAGADGWGIPMATDVAFALGVLALLGSRVPAELKVLLLALAIVDDVGAIIVIAVFYSDGLEWRLVRRRRRRPRCSWRCSSGRGSGTCPSTSCSAPPSGSPCSSPACTPPSPGVALGLLAPARPFLPEVDADRIAGELSADQDVTAAEVREHLLPAPRVGPGHRAPREPPAPVDQLPDRPALRARQRRRRGVRRVASRRRHRTGHPGRRRGAGRRQARRRGRRHRAGACASAADACPRASRPRHVVGMAGIAGIGFTVSLFVAGLAFERPELADQAKIGVLVASVIAAGVGALILGRGARRRRAEARPPAMARIHERCVNRPLQPRATTGRPLLQGSDAPRRGRAHPLAARRR